MVCRYTARTPDEQITAASAAHTFGRRVGTDYITEYKFQLDGSVRVGFDFAGYMETRWFSQAATPYERQLGEVVRANLVAPLHSHFGCFRVDLDGVAQFAHTDHQLNPGAKAPIFISIYRSLC